MDKRFIGVFVFAILVALATSYAVYRLLANRVASTPQVQTQKVQVAARDLGIGTVLKETDLREVEWGAPIPKNAVIKKEELLERGVTNPVSDGEMFTDARLAPKGSGAGLASTIPIGKRAIAIRVNEVVGLAGYVLPGMKVDVIALGRPAGTYGPQDLGTLARTLLQNIQVLSAGQNMQRDPDGKPVTVQVVNLLVSPEEAEQLSLAENEAKIQLVLRNPLDEEKVDTPGTATAYLFSHRPARPLPGLAGQPPAGTLSGPRVRRATPAPPRPPVMQQVVVPVTMEIISGAKKDNVKVGETLEERPVAAKK